MAIDRLLTWHDLKDRIPFSRVHLSRLEARGEFPKRLQLGAGRVAWLEREVQQWIEDRQRGPLPLTPRKASHVA